MRLSAESLALGPERGLRAVGHVELAEDPGQVRLDGLLADLEPAGDQLVRQTLDEQDEDLLLARGQAGERVWLGAGAEDRARGARVERRFAAGRGADPLRDVLGRRVLEQVAAGAGLERAEDAWPIARTP